MIYKAYYFRQNKIKKHYGFILIGLSVLLLLSLVSYSVTDACINVVNNDPVKNFIGKTGAIVSDLLFQYFGFSAYFLPIVLSYWGSLSFFLGRFNMPKTKIISLILSMCIMSCILGIFEDYNFKFQMLPGGYLGYYVCKSFFQKLSVFVSISVLVLALLIPMFAVFFNFTTFKKVKKGEENIHKNKDQKPTNTILELSKLLIFLFKIFTKPLRENNKLEKKIKKKKAPFLIKEMKENKREKIVKTEFEYNETEGRSDYTPPSTELLNHVKNNFSTENSSFFEERIQKLSQTLREFGIKGEVLGYQRGPVVTLYEFKPRAGIKASRIIGLSDDIARNMKVEAVRIATILGKDTLGMEIPNNERAIVSFRKIIECEKYRQHSGKLPIVLGSNIFGAPMIFDLATMPHLLVAGTTGSGKSVGINTIILSMLYRMSPQECKFIMIDPKMLELSPYNGIPHLVTSVITEPQKAVLALKWVVREMEDRYRKMSEVMVKNIEGYNTKVKSGRIQNCEYFPYLVVIIDEMADLMLVAGKEIEVLVQRLSQMARAAGIHLIMATQRPSVDVITGVIKANFPTRISYQVTSKVDSRTIIGEQGAEQLLGKGDMLFMTGGSKTSRVHGPLVVDNEVERVVEYLKKNYESEYIELEVNDDSGDFGGDASGGDDLYQNAVNIVLGDKKTSISYLQRKLRIGYNKAATLIEKMEEDGILSEADHTGKREILK